MLTESYSNFGLTRPRRATGAYVCFEDEAVQRCGPKARTRGHRGHKCDRYCKWPGSLCGVKCIRRPAPVIGYPKYSFAA